MNIKNMLFKALIVLIAVTLIGCNSETNEGDKDTKEETNSELRVAFNAQPPTLDTHITTAYQTRDISRQMFETLLTIDSNYQIKPMLAESYDVSEDGKTITFHLRQGVKFHNGEEMKAEDVVASMNRWKELSLGAKTAISNSVFEAQDDYTVLLKLEKPSGIALSVLAGTSQAPSIMPKEIIDAATEEGVEEYVGTGPFQFEEWKQDQYIKLTKFDDYQALSDTSDGLSGKKEALVNDLYFMMITDPSTRVAGIQSGEYDVAVDMPFDDYEKFNTDESMIPLTFNDAFIGLVLNKKEGPLSDVKMRQAALAALNMEEIMYGVFGDEGFFRLDHGLMRPEQKDWYSESGKESYNQNNPEKAREILEETDYNGEPIRLIVTRDVEYSYKAAVIIQEQLEKVGMKVELEVYDSPTLRERRADPSAYEGFLTTFAPFTDPTQFIFLDSKNDWDGWTNNPTIDSLLDQIRNSTSPEESKQYFDELQTELYESVPIIKIGDQTTLVVTSKDVEGLNYLDGPLIWNVKNVK
ncbi:ABC transporter substrate-binding protein [Ornithinibacillus sp. 4-3]|uniref:ABC transporter substrate-binding protein n=1 Tax=Ornithinibacillus sp. 4-3 TaxID=3231488 RepID=A0AB39HS76_9BACI